MSTHFQITRRVEFGDTDMAGIMHFSNFFRFMEVAETDFWHSRGLSVAWAAGDERFGFPRVSATCDFVNPARFEDILTITVQIEQIGRKSVRFRYDFTKESLPIATGRITAVFCRKGAKNELESLDIPPDLRAKLEA